MPSGSAGPVLDEGLGYGLLLMGELQRVGRALRADGVEFIVLKGLPLAVRLTNRIDGRHRRIRDNDLLVRERDAVRAVEVLRRLGYEEHPGMTLASQLVVNFELEMFRRLPEGGGLIAEIHWAAFPPLLYPVDENVLWSRTETVEVGGYPVQVFDRELTLIHLASHFVQHAASVAWVLRDLAMAWNRWANELDHAALFDLATRLRLQHVLAFSMAAASDLGLLEVAPPPFPSYPAAVLRRVLPSQRLGPPQPVATVRRSLELLLLAPPEQLTHWLRYRMLPTRAAVAASCGLRSPAEVRPWHYLARPARALLRRRKYIG